MALYPKEYLYINERVVLHMAFVESMGFPDDVDAVIGKLKGDLHLDVFTVGGRQYSISMNLQRHMTQSGSPILNNQDLREAIYGKWIHLVKG